MSDKASCWTRVYHAWLSATTPCSRAGVIERDGKFYCRQHDPVGIAGRRAIQEAKYKQAFAVAQARRRIERAAPDLLDALERAHDLSLDGRHEDARDLMRAAIAKARSA